ncbi:MAG: hypothetical protein WBA73_14025 [Devosia sp.]
MTLIPPPGAPQAGACESAYQILATTHATCESFLTILQQVMKDRNAQGGPNSSEQDLLRATLVFASSGLDAMIKQLVQDALPDVLDANNGENGASENFASYVQTTIARDPAKASDILARSLTAYSSRDTLVGWFQRQLTANSLQSKDQIFQTASYFDIPTELLCKGGEQAALGEAFKIRNKIIHEMDVDFAQNDSRTERTWSSVVDATNLLLTVASRFLTETAARV